MLVDTNVEGLYVLIGSIATVPRIMIPSNLEKASEAMQWSNSPSSISEWSMF